MPQADDAEESKLIEAPIRLDDLNNSGVARSVKPSDVEFAMMKAHYVNQSLNAHLVRIKAALTTTP
jgi:hypothetical protein